KTSNTIKLADLADDLAKDINIKIPEIDTVLPESLTRPHIPEPRPDIPGAKPDIPETRPDIPETRPETPEPVHDTPPENPAPEPGRGAEPAPEPAQEPKPIDTSGDPTGPHSDPVKHDKTNDADEPTTPAEDHTPATETHPDQADHPASETHSHTGDAADGDGSGPAHPAPRLPDVHDYGTDLSQVSHHETQLADISRGIPHSEEFTAVESTRNSLADTSHELTEQAKPILQDLHENHGINWTTRQMSRSDFDEVMNKATDQALKAGDTALARKIDSLYDIWFDQLDTKTALTHASEELGSVGGDDVLAHYGVTRGGGGVGAGKGSFDKFGVSGDGSQLFVLEEKGGGATVNSAGRVVEDGTRAPQGSAAYFTDIAKHDTVFQEFLSRPENASLAQGLKDGTVEARYLLAKSAGDGTTVLSEFLMNPDSIDWNQILGG
ncbi:MAG: hypothetical protein LBI84_10035, partial [Propionibacteriaceae bacterium]|nr:hypothetical protein [Propionibacteriaceae bacterium]